MCGHLPILIARSASNRFQWLMAMIGLRTGEPLLGLEKVGSSESPVAPLVDVRLAKTPRAVLASSMPTTATQMMRSNDWV
jgi:hypothetical protein